MSHLTATFRLTLLALLFCLSASAQDTSRTQVQGIHDRYVLSLVEDRQQRVWIGTEDQGVWRLDESNARPRWKQFTVPDGLGDESIHALACDQQGRIWAGHLNHGVSVWNGEKWRNYPVGEGPIGERVYDIAVNPRDGSVWIATNCGLSRYDERAKTWNHFTQENGLPENAVCALAFAPNGDLIVGSESHGIALAFAVSSYRYWRVVSGPDKLPSDLINDVLVTPTGAIFVATTNGLARSDDHGQSWSVLHGRDNETTAPNAAAPITIGQFHFGLSTIEATPLAEDYVTCLAQDSNGRLWLGFRREGYQVRDAQTLHLLSDEPVVENAHDVFMRAILPRSTGQAPLLGLYGRGSQTANDKLRHLPVQPLPVPAVADLPTPARAPNATELAQMLQRLLMVPPLADSNVPTLAALDDDWRTQGDWLGRYGRYQAVLAAMLSPNDYLWGAGETMMPYSVRIGPHANADDSLRYWIQNLYTQTPESLELPAVYYHSRVSHGLDKSLGQRRQAEWDDHGEEYPMSLDGPHVYASIQIPQGWFVLSLYDWNKDGQIGSNRWRDYKLSARTHPDNVPLSSLEGFERWPDEVRGRIHDFRGGVWKRFLVRGPQSVTVEVNRHHSFNTILAGLFLDRWEAQPAPYFGTTEDWQGHEQERAVQRGRLLEEVYVSSRKAQRTQRFAAGNSDGETAQRVWQALQEARLLNPIWHETKARPYYLALLSWCRKNQNQDAWQRDCVAAGCYQLHLYPQWETEQRAAGLVPARDLELELRWDGVSNYAGRGFQVVSEAVAQRQKLSGATLEKVSGVVR